MPRTKAEPKKPKKQLDHREIVQLVGKSLNMLPMSLKRDKYVESTISTGCLALDLILGGGYPIGRWVNLIGPTGAGKSTLLYTFIAVLQRRDAHVMLFDHERGTDPMLLKSIGVSLDERRIDYMPADLGEGTYRFIRRYLKQLPNLTPDQRKDLRVPVTAILIDSLASMLTEAMDEAIEKDQDNMRIQLAQATMHSKYLPAIRSLITDKGCMLITTNQIRHKPMAFGNPEYQSGGNAVQHYPDVMIRLGGRAAEDKNTEGNKNYDIEESLWSGGGQDKLMHTVARTLKNRQFAPYHDARMRINLGRGMDPIYDAYTYLDKTGQLQEGKKGFVIITDEDELKCANWREFSRLVTSPKFRRKCFKQLDSDIAFRMFMETQSRRTKMEFKRGADPLAVYDLEEEEEGKSKKRKSKTD
jgi:RecA/RadA recombinase